MEKNMTILKITYPFFITNVLRMHILCTEKFFAKIYSQQKI